MRIAERTVVQRTSVSAADLAGPEFAADGSLTPRMRISNIEPISATRELVAALGVTKQQNLLLLRETYYVEHHEAVLYSENRINSELLSFYVRRTPKSQTPGPLSGQRVT
jgi:DNA-binding GntR family transcriptional regulator